MGCDSCGSRQRGTKPPALPMPAVASRAEWQRAREQLLAKEKAATRQLDALAAERRRLPMVVVPKTYRFEGAGGATTLEGLFDGRRQLVVYHFMYGPDWDSPCPGCSRRMDDVGHLAHLHARQTSFVVVARTSYERLAATWQRKGWTMPVYSSGSSDFNQDMGVTVDGDEDFGLSVFFRDDAGAIYRSYFTTGRGVEPAGFRQLLDMTPYGRQEDWEDSPMGWPQSTTYGWGSDRDE
jgi:predicted dithiol-disulfide oxidoreductase (DUF899 family)